MQADKFPGSFQQQMDCGSSGDVERKSERGSTKRKKTLINRYTNKQTGISEC